MVAKTILGLEPVLGAFGIGVVLSKVDNEIKITKEDILSEDYDWVEEIYKIEWKCTCGNIAYNYNVRELEAGEDPECPHCHRIIHTMDNRNWG